MPFPPPEKRTLSRRELLAAAAALPAAAAAALPAKPEKTPAPGTRKGKRLHVAVVGAGAFGGHAALYLLRSGARVTLVDAWGPGNSRASSGGETRVIRGVYGPDRVYVEMARAVLRAVARERSPLEEEPLHADRSALDGLGRGRCT